MGIGVSILLLALGAVLFWGVDYEVAGVDLDAVGVFAMAVGVLGALLVLMTSTRGGKVRRDYRVER
jgi:hypothetical protein